MSIFLRRIFSVRIIRYALCGGIGIPINDLALLFFMRFFWPHWYPVASAYAFEVSTTVNFVLNQLFTYNDQHLHGFDWVKRAAKAQLTSLSALGISYCCGLVLVYVFHVNQYLANPMSIILAFGYNFFISKKLVFRATEKPIEEQDTIPELPNIIVPKRKGELS
jgi:putative flippase GtrA